MANELTDLEVDEVSLVDKGANRKRFLIIKNNDANGGEAVKPEDIKQEGAEEEAVMVKQWLDAETAYNEAVTKYLEAEGVAKWLEAETAYQKESEKADLAPDVLAAIKTAIKALSGLLANAATEPPIPGMPPVPPAPPAQKSDEPVTKLAEALTALDEKVQSILDKAPVRKSIEGQDGPPEGPKDNWPSLRI